MTLVVLSILSRSKLVLAIFIILYIASALWIDYFGFTIADGILPAAPNINGTVSGPAIQDPILNVETVFKGLKSPTSMAFLGQNDILVLEKDNGTVQRIINGKMLPQPLLRVPVANKDERGMLGIAVA